MKKIEVLGSGCKSCHTLHKAVLDAVSRLDLDAEVAYITDMEQILASGVMRMPALAVDGQVVSAGRVLNRAQVEKLLLEL